MPCIRRESRQNLERSNSRNPVVWDTVSKSTMLIPFLSYGESIHAMPLAEMVCAGRTREQCPNAICFLKHFYSVGFLGSSLCFKDYGPEKPRADTNGRMIIGKNALEKMDMKNAISRYALLHVQ